MEPNSDEPSPPAIPTRKNKGKEIEQSSSLDMLVEAATQRPTLPPLMPRERPILPPLMPRERLTDRYGPPPFNNWGPAYLTDNPLDINETGDIAMFSDRDDPNINPVPPQVRKEYWARLYRKAGSMLYEDVENDVVAEMAAEAHAVQDTDTSLLPGEEDDGGGGVPVDGIRRMSLDEGEGESAAKRKERKRRIKARMQQAKADWALWRLALKLMVRDIVYADAGTGGGAVGAHRRRTLRETRCNLSDPFFDFMESMPNCGVLPINLVPDEAFFNDGGPGGWHGDGMWMTQMRLD